MPKEEIDDKPYTESTRTKLELFQRYTREWLPVFLGEKTRFPEINICDFFSGSGTDSEGVWGSALRVLKVIEEFRGLVASRPVTLRVFLSDSSTGKIERLKERIKQERFDHLPIEIETRDLSFEKRFSELRGRLYSADAANLIFVDQYGVKHLDATFDDIVNCPSTDWLAFLSSSWFQRFHSLPAVEKYLVDHRPEAYHQAHRAAMEAYRKRLPQERKYYLGEFSLKSGSNIYGVVFGSAHLLGMTKFLKSAWQLDGTNGSANFDVEREGLYGDWNELQLDLGLPKKVQLFEADLEHSIRNGDCRNESDVLEICVRHGVTPQHATPTLKKLKKEEVLQASWWVPDPKNHREPRPLFA